MERGRDISKEKVLFVFFSTSFRFDRVCFLMKSCRYEERKRERERDKSEKREVRIETHTYNTPGKCRTVSLHAAFRSARVASISESFPLQLVEMQKDRRYYADLLMINSNIKIISILYEDLISNSLSKNEYNTHLQIIRKDSTI